MDQVLPDPVPRRPALRVYWWRKVPNFGDILSAKVVAHVSGRRVRHAQPGHCDLFALGSILQAAQRRMKEPRPDGTRPWVWGSGILRRIPTDFVPNMRVALLRGPLSAKVLGLDFDRFGDPGLIAPELYPRQAEQRDRIAIVPHHSEADNPELAALVAADPVYQMIDPRTDPEAVCQAIASCRAVVASSLHGLIVADAYGVPNLWVQTPTQARFKYRDYAASVGRKDLAAGTGWAEAMAAAKAVRNTDLPYADGIARSIDDLKRSFPNELRAEQVASGA